MRRFALQLLSVTVTVLHSGCQDEAESGRPCNFTVEEVPWDEPASARELSVVPRDLADALSFTVTGELEYLASNTADVVEATPDRGTTAFTSTLSISGSPRLSWDPEATGSDLLRCPSSLEFDGTIQFSTNDGFFDESWIATVVSTPGVGGFTSEVDLDPDETGTSESFGLTRTQGAEEWETATYRHRLSYSSCTDCDNLLMSGEITYRGQYAATQDGDIIDQSGFTVTLASWSGDAL